MVEVLERTPERLIQPSVRSRTEASELASLVDAVRAALADDPVAATDDELMDAVAAIESLRRVLDAAEARRLGELHARDATVATHGLRTAAWLAHTASLPKGVAAQRVRTATALRTTLDEVADAIDEGAIGWHHAKVLADAANPRIAHHLADLQADLVADAAGTRFDVWARHVRAVADLLDADGGHRPTDDATSLRLAPMLDGTVDLAATFTGLDAAEVVATIEATADELADQIRHEQKHLPDLPLPPRHVLRARALVELCRRGRAIDRHATKPRRADVVLITEASDPLADVTTPAGVPVQDGTIRRLVCDADWHPVVVDSLGVPLDHGRAVRFATAAQRRAVLTRDGGCTIPGCDAPITWVQIHHVDPYGNGHGTTDTPQLCGQCGSHHPLFHEHGWTIHLTDDGWTWITSPTGRSCWGQRHGRQRLGPTPDHPDFDPDAAVRTHDLRRRARQLADEVTEGRHPDDHPATRLLQSPPDDVPRVRVDRTLLLPYTHGDRPVPGSPTADRSSARGEVARPSHDDGRAGLLHRGAGERPDDLRRPGGQRAAQHRGDRIAPPRSPPRPATRSGRA